MNTIIQFSIALVTGIAIYWYFSKNRHKIPKTWKPIGTVTKLFLYPLKTGRRMELDRVICTKKGCVVPKKGNEYQFKDREILCYKEQTLENCEYPKLLLVEVTACDENHFVLTAPDTPSLRVKIPDAVHDRNKGNQVTIWTLENLNKFDCGNDAAKWISQLVCDLDSGLRLAFLDPSLKENSKKRSKKSLKIHPNVKDKAADLYSGLGTNYMVVNQASVDDISSKLPDENVTVNNFRPNILVQGENLKAYDEDNWKWIKIGNVVLYAVKPCLRCTITTINPETGKKSELHEPLRTLRTYRKLQHIKNINFDGHRPVFGNQMELELEGDVKIGDIVFIGR